MQVKTIQPMHVFCFETETTLAEIFQYARFVARRLYREAIAHDLEITGPVYWVYEGADSNPDTVFKLTIALPINPAAPVSGSEFKQKILEPFQCISQELQGEWNGLGNVYGELYRKLGEGNHVPSGQNREIYINMDFQNPAANITEVQVGII